MERYRSGLSIYSHIWVYMRYIVYMCIYACILRLCACMRVIRTAGPLVIIYVERKRMRNDLL